MKMTNETQATQCRAVGASAKRPLPSGSRADASVGLHARCHAEAGTRCRAAADSDANTNNAAVANVLMPQGVTAEPPPPPARKIRGGRMNQPGRTRRGIAPLLLARYLASLALLVVGSFVAPGVAQTPPAGCPSVSGSQEWVCNIDQSPDSAEWVSGSFALGNSFSTGNAAHGYHLQSVNIPFENKEGNPANLVVAIYNNNPTKGSEFNGNETIGSSIATLSGSNPNTAGTYTYTASGDGLFLEKNTQYWLVLHAPGTPSGSRYNVAITNSNSESGSSGWTIGNVYCINGNDCFSPAFRFAVIAEPAPSNDATLSALAVEGVTITFDGTNGFMPDTNNYFTNVPSSFTTATLTMTTTHAGATIAVTQDGATLSGDFAAGVTSNPLMVGNNVFSITVTAEDGTTMMTYQVNLIRAASSDATLSALAVADATLDSGAGSGFMPDTNNYFTNVPSSFTTATLTMTTTHAGATIAVTQDGATLSGDFAAGVTSNPLMVGSNVFSITVTAEDGTTMETYTLTVVVDSALKLKLRVFLESALP